MYNKTVMDHFRNPRNVGVIEDAVRVEPDGEIEAVTMTGRERGARIRHV